MIGDTSSYIWPDRYQCSQNRQNRGFTLVKNLKWQIFGRKKSDGGFGYRNLEDFNTTLLAKKIIAGNEDSRFIFCLSV